MGALIYKCIITVSRNHTFFMLLLWSLGMYSPMKPAVDVKNSPPKSKHLTINFTKSLIW